MAEAEATNESAGRTALAQDGGGNKFQHAISAWRTVDLTGMVSALDNTASEIVTYQRDSTVQRKELAQKTKDFRKLDDTSKLSEIKGLLKSYQTFIDLLTNHSKSINSAFLKAYTSLSEAPDPYPLLEASVDSMLLTEETLPKLSAENNHLQQTVAKLTGQLEDTEGRLQTERVARQGLNENLESRVKAVEETWTATLAESKESWEAKEKALEEKVESQDRLLSEMRASHEVNQRLGRADDASAEGRSHVASAEVEMLHSDLERTSSRLAEVESRNEQLRVELAQAKSQVPPQQQQQSALSVEDDPGYMRMRSENSSLVRKLDSARIERETLRRDLGGCMRGLEREVGLLKEERDSLRNKMHRWSDYEDVKRELEVLKSIEFSTGDDDDDDDDTDSTREEALGGAARGETLEKLLLARNKKLGDELTVLRVSHRDLQSRLESVQEQLTKAGEDRDAARSLNEKLENDIATLQSEGAYMFSSAASVAGTYVSRFHGSSAPNRRGGRVSPTSSIISGISPRHNGGGYDSEVGVGAGAGILPMITAQRDRLKKRMAELEHELAESHRTVSELRQEVAALQRDNLNLYEKTRYVSAFNRSGGGPAASSSSSSSAAYAHASPNPNPSSVYMGGGNGSSSVDRYRKAYESNLSLSPFAAWRGRESARAYRHMSLPERMVYSVTRMVLASRASRNLFAAYCVALHLLVFLAVYHMGACDVESHATPLAGGGGGAAAAAAAAMAGSVGDGEDWSGGAGGKG